jgi:4'-phosphopantetheinyl transferase
VADAPDIGGFELRLWRITLNTAVLGVEIGCLSDEERRRAAQFRRQVDRDRWVAGHVFLRRVLGRELGLPAGDIAFVARPHGKPALDRTAGRGSVHFNFTHSADIAIVAVTRAGEVGVDVERRRNGIDAERLARTGIGDAAAAQLSELPPAARADAFYRLWVRHEATVKCLGTGLGTGPDQPHEEPWLADVDIAPGYVAAVAVLPRYALTRGQLRVTVLDDTELESWLLGPKRQKTSGRVFSDEPVCPVDTETDFGAERRSV